MDAAMATGNGLQSVEHVVLLMLENRSFDHMLGFLYTDQGNVSPSGQPYAGLTGSESNPDSAGQPVVVFRIEPTAPNAYFMPGADPGEGYKAANSQLFGNVNGPGSPAEVPGCQGFVKDFAYTLGWQSRKQGWPIVPGTVPGDIMGCFAPDALPVLSAPRAAARGGRAARRRGRRVRLRLHQVRGAGAGRARVAADRAGHRLPRTRRRPAGPHVGAEDPPGALGPALADRQGRRRAQPGGRGDACRAAHVRRACRGHGTGRSRPLPGRRAPVAPAGGAGRPGLPAVRGRPA